MLDEDNEQGNFYQIACVQCGEHIFKFSKFTIMDSESMEFHCPKCGKVTTVNRTFGEGTGFRSLEIR